MERESVAPGEDPPFSFVRGDESRHRTKETGKELLNVAHGNRGKIPTWAGRGKGKKETCLEHRTRRANDGKKSLLGRGGDCPEKLGGA